MATKEDQETLRLLVQHVSRAFYEPKYVVIMDQLARHPVLKDDELAGRIGLQSKELNKIMTVLSTDRLVNVHRQNELKEGAQRSIGKQYYYINYPDFCNVVKWRVAEMHRIIDSTLRNELDNKGYICPNCQATFLPLEIDRLFNMELNKFICDQCSSSPMGPTEIIDNDKADNVVGGNDRMERFNKQTSWIQDGLRKSEAMLLPAFDVSLWIKQNLPSSSSAAAPSDPSSGSGLKIAGSGPSAQDDTGISVLMSVDKDEATRKKEREREAEAKRAQNMMPAWHLKSTISGDLTALGHAANSLSANANAAASGSGGAGSNAAILEGLGGAESNADMLKGLGKIKIPKKEKDAVSIVSVKSEKSEAQKNADADFYDQYYADLEAAAQSQPTTRNTNTPQLDNLSDSFDFDDPDIDRKPSIQYLDSLQPTPPPLSTTTSSASFSSSLSNSFSRKRSREPSVGLMGLGADGWADGRAREKALKSSSGTPIYSRSNSGTEVGFGDRDASMDPFDREVGEENGIGEVNGETADDPVVYVGGQPMPFSQVTQEIADEKMSTEEYTAWYDLVMAQAS